MYATPSRRGPLRYIAAGCATASLIASCTGLAGHRTAGLLILAAIAAFLVDLVLDPPRKARR